MTGASGFLGHHLARQGLAGGAALHVLGRRPGPEGSVLHRADLSDADAVGQAVAALAPEAVIHCAAPGVAHGSMDYAGMLAVTEQGTRALYAACAALPRPPAVVQVGSGFEYAPSAHAVAEDWPLMPAPQSYGAAKVAASRVAQEFADRLSIALLRPFHVYGAGEAGRRLGPFLIGEARAGRAVPLTACEQRRDFLHVDDCAAMLWDALTRLDPAPSLTCRNLGSGRSIGLAEFVAAVTAELAANGIAADCQIGALAYREGEPMVSLPNISRWIADGGRVARVSLAEGVADLVRAELTRCP
jgi:nucleoside-diphosphate-sugar epimerase